MKIVWTKNHTQLLRTYATTNNIIEYNEIAKKLYPIILDMTRVTYITYYRNMYFDKNKWYGHFRDWASDVLVNLKKYNSEKANTQSATFSFVLSTIKNRIKSDQYQLNHYGHIWEKPIQSTFEDGFDYIENVQSDIWTSNTTNKNTELIVEFIEKKLDELEERKTKKRNYNVSKTFLKTFLQYIDIFGLKSGGMPNIVNYIHEETDLTENQILNQSRKFFHYEHKFN